MRELNAKHTAAIRDMINAFREMSDQARRHGVDHRLITRLHGRFFDGKVAADEAYGAAAILAWSWCDQHE